MYFTQMYMYYKYLYIYIFVDIHLVYFYICIFTHIYIYDVCIHHIYIYILSSLYVRVYMYTCLCIYIYMYHTLYMFVYLCIWHVVYIWRLNQGVQVQVPRDPRVWPKTFIRRGLGQDHRGCIGKRAPRGHHIPSKCISLRSQMRLQHASPLWRKQIK